MNVNIVLSFVIGGIIILILGSMNRNVSYSNTDVVLSQTTQIHRGDIAEVVAFDFPKMGYAPNLNTDSLIIAADSNSVTFLSNIDNSSNGSVETIKWEFTTTDITNGTNPNDKLLIRVVDTDTTRFTLGVTRFRLNFYDDLGSTTPLAFPLNITDLSTVRQIEVIMVVESPELLEYSTNQAGRYINSAWVKRFTPRNLAAN